MDQDVPCGVVLLNDNARVASYVTETVVFFTEMTPRQSWVAAFLPLGCHNTPTMPRN